MDSKNVKQSVFWGVFWKFAESIMGQLVSLVVSIIIARILNPEDYSVVGIVTIFFTFANVFISGGLNTALIQKRETDDEDYSSVLYVSTLVAIIIYTSLFFLAPWVAQIYNQPILIPIMRVMGLILPVNAVKSIWCARISSSMKFKKFFYATIGATVVSGLVGIIMAMRGFGAWALVAQQMTNAVVGTVILIATTRIRIYLRISWSKLKGLLGYGWKVFLSSVISVLYAELNPIVIGLKYSAVDLSYYTKGRSFPQLLSTNVIYTLSAVLFPALSKYQDDKQALLNYTRRFIRQASFITFPLMLGMFAVAESFVLVILGEKWIQAVPYIQIFCISGMFDIIQTGNCETIKAMGRSDVYLIIEIIKKTAYFCVIGLLIWLSNSPEVLAAASIICSLIATIVNSIPNRKLIGYKTGMLIMDMLPNFFTALLMCVSVMLIGMLPVHKTVLLFVQVATGIVVYVVANLIIKNNNLNYMWNIARNIMKGK